MRIKLLKCHGHWSNTKDCEPFLYAPCLDSLNRLIMQSVDEAALASWEMHQCHRGAAYYGSFGSGGVLFGSLRKPLACSNA
jgi:hypothetical protein